MKKLNFSCGNDIKEGWDNCDWQKGKNVIFCDANKFPYPFKKNTYDYIYARNCLQLFNEPRKVLEELWRISKDGAIIEVITAHWHNKGAYTDLDTKHFFNEQSFIKLVEGNCRIEYKPKFKIEKIKLVQTKIGKFIPFREKLSNIFGGLIGEMNIKLKVIK
jgi:ubiquinone/menaquinone biosynthesis C-methylase UbiE